MRALARARRSPGGTTHVQQVQVAWLGEGREGRQMGQARSICVGAIQERALRGWRAA